jgi:hypothetical protein
LVLPLKAERPQFGCLACSSRKRSLQTRAKITRYQTVGSFASPPPPRCITSWSLSALGCICTRPSDLHKSVELISLIYINKTASHPASLRYHSLAVNIVKYITNIN